MLATRRVCSVLHGVHTLSAVLRAQPSLQQAAALTHMTQSTSRDIPALVYTRRWFRLNRVVDDTKFSDTLRATAEINPQQLGAAIAAKVREHGFAEIRSVRARAAYQGLKAVVAAGEYLAQDDGALQGKVFAVTISEKREPLSTNDDDRNKKLIVMMIKAQLHPNPPSRNVTELRVGAKSNAGKVAAAIASSMRMEAGTGSAVVRAMGAVAVHQSMIACTLAQEYLDNDGRGVKFIILPCFDILSTEQMSGELKRQLVLRIERTSN